MKTRQTIRILLAALIISGCALLTPGCTTLPGQQTTPVTATGQDLQTAVAQATQAYIAVKSGDVSYAWSAQHGLAAYQLYLKTKADVKNVIQQWTDGTKAGKTFAEKVAALFANSSASPEAKAAALTSGVQAGAEQHASP